MTNNPILGLIEEESNIEDYLTSAIIDNNIGKIFISSNKNNNRNSLEVIFDYPKPILRQWKIIDHQKKKLIFSFLKLNMRIKLVINILLQNNVFIRITNLYMIIIYFVES